MSSLSKLFGSGGLLGKSQSPLASVNPVTAKVDAIVQGTAAAREKLASMLPAQSAVGRAMRAFNSGGNPISGLIKMVGSIFKGSKYRSDQYWLGEKYMFYILGIPIRERKKVEDPMVAEAMEFFGQLLGVPIDSWTAVEELKKSTEEYKRNRKPNASQEAIDKAQKILNSFPENDVPGSWQSGIVDLANASIGPSNALASLGLGGSSGKFVLFAIGGIFLIWIIRKLLK